MRRWFWLAWSPSLMTSLSLVGILYRWFHLPIRILVRMWPAKGITRLGLRALDRSLETSSCFAFALFVRLGPRIP